ncbi:WD40/YVTN/BNR-like repeat-containing protein [Acidobacteriota bacterium]
MRIGRKQKTVFLFTLGILLTLTATESIHSQMDNSGLAKAFKWRNIGPANMSGRISDIEALDSDFTTALIGSASGGVWKTINAGITWDPIFDTYGAASIGDVAFFQQNPEIIWVGTGEKNPRNSIAWGDGIYKSIDGGKSFTHIGLKSTHSISKVITHPSDPDVVYVGAGGHLWGYSGDRGLFKTTDGGKTWKKLTNGLPDDGKTGVIDMVMDPSNENVLYVGFWQRIRRPYRFDSGGPNGGIFKSTDAGESWKKLANGLPDGDIGKIGLAICRSKPNVLMAFVEHGFRPREKLPDGSENPEYKDMSKLGTGIYRTEDGGEAWQYMNRYNNRPFYYSHIYLNPLDDKIVYVVTGSYHISYDGGKTLERQNTGIHGDYHALWSDPDNKDRYYIGNDGGAALTYDHGKNYIFFDNLPLGQFYAIGADMRDPYYVYGGLQDNGSWGGPSLSRDSQGILTDHWFRIGGGDGFYTPADPTDWRIVYAESQQGNIRRVNVETREAVPIKPNKENIINYDDYVTEKILKLQEEGGWGKDNPFRFNWNSPIVISHFNPSTVFFGGNFLFKTMDRGESWEIISPDLTTQDPIKIDRKTGGLTPDVTGAENHCAIITISESPLKPEIIWVGTDDGNVQLTRDGGKNWTNVRPNFKGVPEGIWVSRVEASHYNEGTCYVTFDGHRSDNFLPWVFKTTNFGQTWTPINSNLPEGQVAYVIREDHKNKNLLFLGTEFGIFLSTNGGKRWDRFMNNLPTVAVHDILIHPLYNDVIIGTHGRSIWVCDDITPLQQVIPEIENSSAFLFDQRVATQWKDLSRGGSRGQFLFKGENPPRGAKISYYLGADTKETKLSISDWAEELKYTIELKDQRGINKHLWDFQFPPPELNEKEKKLFAKYTAATESQVRREIDKQLRESLEKRGQKYAGIDRRAQKINTIPAEAGVYKVTLTANGVSLTKPLTVRKDPLFN